jgi:hypothetical protein
LQVAGSYNKGQDRLHELVFGSAAVVLYLSSPVSTFAELSFRSSSTAQTTAKQCSKLHEKWNLSFCPPLDFRAEIHQTLWGQKTQFPVQYVKEVKSCEFSTKYVVFHVLSYKNMYEYAERIKLFRLISVFR